MTRERDNSTWKTVVFLGAAAIAAYFAVPDVGAKDAIYSVIGIGAVESIIVGVWRHRPYAARSWLALGAGFCCFVLGDSVYDLYQYVLHRPTPFPSAADALYLAGYPFVALGIAGITRRRTGAVQSREGYVDAAVVALGALALSWHFLMGPYVHDPTVGSFGKLVNLAYPILDLAVFAVVVHALVFGVARRSVHRILAMAFLAMVAADFTYDLMSRLGTYTTGDAVDAGWLINYVLVGAAALHPSAVAGPLADPHPPANARARLPIVVIAGLIAPTILLVSAGHSSSDVAPLAVLSGIIFVLIVVRVQLLLRQVASQSRALEDSLATRDALEDELRHRAFHDTLTGLANRALLQDRVGHAIERVYRAGGSVGLCFCDLDGFKTVNDSLGHLVGDALLVVAGRRLSSVLRPGDTVARLGGDEFAVLVEDVDDPATVLAVAERIVAVLREPMEAAGHSISISVSVGVAVGGRHATPESLLAEADSAMYEAKAAGRDRYAMFEAAMLDRVRERLELTNHFGGALDREEFFLEYQPQFSLATGGLEGFETSLRWRHPTLGVLAGAQFLDLADQSGHIVAIGRWVVEQACEEAARWRRGGTELAISVNLSRRQLVDGDLVDDVRTALALSSLPPRLLTLCYEEHVVMAERHVVLPVLQALRAIGVRLAVENVGSGYSSLQYLREFPIDTLKIDKSFVDPLADAETEGAAFVSTIVELAHRLGFSTVADGLEMPAQRERLLVLGCDRAQGHLLGQPLTARAAAELAATRGSSLTARPGD